ALEEKETIIAKAATLRKQSALFLRSQAARKPLTDRLVLEAQRAELIRLFTQGLTGFDVPASGNTLPEARQVWQTLTQDISPYLDLLSSDNQVLAKNIRSYLSKGETLLKANNDFDSFDRLAFLREALDPLFGALYDLHIALGIETYYETTASQKPQQYFAKNIFSPDFLDAAYYVPLPSRDPRGAQKQTLGKLLFFDPALSGSNERACASCHSPARAFTDGASKSVALDFKGTVDRNAPTLINAVYSERYFHDLRADDLTAQIEGVVTNEKEFHTDFYTIADKLAQSPEYVRLFREAFPEEGSQPINRQSITLAIGSYIASLTSWNSPFDRYARGESEALDESAKRGFNLFMGKAACGTCHFAPVFNGTVPPEYVESESEVLGVALTPALKHATPDPDEGRFANKRAAEKADFQRYAFKTPTLRNIALTAPYMHNGAYMTLEQIMDFDNKGGGAGIGIPLPNQTLPTDPLNLN
ncbi:MAG: cytochrome-c peroxidase, partial [Bacteroidetes bacterium]